MRTIMRARRTAGHSTDSPTAPVSLPFRETESAPLTYEIRTLADFRKVPTARLEDCLREFSAFMEMGRELEDLVTVVGAVQAPGAGVIGRVDDSVFWWIDDGKGTVTLTVSERISP